MDGGRWSGTFLPWWAMALSCGGAPKPAPPDADPAPRTQRSADARDSCAQTPGKPPPKPLIKEYEGVAAKARCQREVYTIMGGLTHHLGVKCAHCHDENDYAKMTHQKHVANWMAKELIPSLEKRRGGGEIWCNDCHVVRGKGTAKILGNPRDPRWAAEWMTTHLVDEFGAVGGKPLRCRACHGGNLGSPAFKKRIILQGRLAFRPGKPEIDAEPTSPAATPPDAAVPSRLGDGGAADAASEGGSS